MNFGDGRIASSNCAKLLGPLEAISQQLEAAPPVQKAPSFIFLSGCE
jgi:hypothetical protein